MKRLPSPRTGVLAALVVALLGSATACGITKDDDPQAEPRTRATVTVTASPSSEPSTASEPSPTDQPNTTPTTAPEPAPVDLSGYELPGFSTPTGNIGCLFDDYQGPHVRCDRLKMQGTPSGRPADCDFDWGHSVEMSADGRAALACTSDSVMGMQGETDGTRKLPYGDSVRYRGITCTSTKLGLACRTGGGHSFLISRAAIRVN